MNDRGKQHLLLFFLLMRFHLFMNGDGGVSCIISESCRVAGPRGVWDIVPIGVTSEPTLAFPEILGVINTL